LSVFVGWRTFNAVRQLESIDEVWVKDTAMAAGTIDYYLIKSR
jgi:hypothetical protein